MAYPEARDYIATHLQELTGWTFLQSQVAIQSHIELNALAMPKPEFEPALVTGLILDAHLPSALAPAVGHVVAELLAHNVFEETHTPEGAYRVYVRNLVNRQGMGVFRAGNVDPTRNPRVLEFVHRLEFQQVADTYQHGVERLATLVLDTLDGVLTATDTELIESVAKRADHPGNNWRRFLDGAGGGSQYLRGLRLGANNNPRQYYSDRIEREGWWAVQQELCALPQVGEPLAANFVADLGVESMLKLDTWLSQAADELAGIARLGELNRRAKMTALRSITYMVGLQPRQLDKLCFIAGSGRLHLIADHIPDHGWGAQRLREMLGILLQRAN